MKINQKIISGFVLVILLVGLVGHFGMRTSESMQESFASEVKVNNLVLKVAERGVITFAATLAEDLEEFALLEERATQLRDEIDLLDDELLQDPNVKNNNDFWLFLDIKNRHERNQEQIFAIHKELLTRQDLFGKSHLVEEAVKQRLRELVQATNDLALIKSFGTVEASSSQAIFQFQNRERVDAWLELIRELRVQVESRFGQGGRLANQLKVYEQTAEIVGDIVVRDSLIKAEEAIIIAAMRKHEIELTDLSAKIAQGLSEMISNSSEGSRNSLVFAILAALMITVGTGFLVSYFISAPIKNLTETARGIARGNLNKRVTVKSKDEIGQLAGAFNYMTDKLQTSYGELKKQSGEIRKYSQSLEKMVKQRTAELEAAKEKSELLLSSIGDGVFAIGVDQKIIHFNRQAEIISGFSSQEVLNKPYHACLRFIKEKDRKINQQFIKTALSGKTTSMANHTVLVRKDGSEVPVSDSAAPIKDKLGKVLGAIVVFRDSQKERQIEHMREEMVSLAGHELKAPLTAIRWKAESLQKGKLGANEKAGVLEIEQAAKSMLGLIGNVLDVSKIEQGRIVLKSKPVQFQKIVESVIKDLAPVAQKRGVKVEFKKPVTALPLVNVDPKYMKEAVQNIISNAVNYTKDQVTVACEAGERSLRFSCLDNGIGIPREDQSKLFRKFYRASNAAKSGIEGTGLGLSITKAIVEKSGGHIWFSSPALPAKSDSDKPKGTVFYISLPLV